MLPANTLEMLVKMVDPSMHVGALGFLSWLAFAMVFPYAPKAMQKEIIAGGLKRVGVRIGVRILELSGFRVSGLQAWLSIGRRMYRPEPSPNPPGTYYRGPKGLEYCI